MTNRFVDDVRYIAAVITAPAVVSPDYNARMTAAIAAAFAAAGITAPSEHLIASVRFTAEVCYGGGDTIAAAAAEGVATWAHLA